MTGLLIVATMILGLTLLIIYRQNRFLESYRDELAQIINESQAVKEELQSLMLQVVQLSDSMVAGLEQQVPKGSAHLEIAAARQTQELRHEMVETNDIRLALHQIIPPASHGQADQAVTSLENNNTDSGGEIPTVYEQVSTLYGEGHSITEIARIMNRGKGEINLILNLNRKRPAIS